MVTELQRFVRHLAMPQWRVRRAFPRRILADIEAAIGRAEAGHTGQIRFAMEAALDVLPLLRG